MTTADEKFAAAMAASGELLDRINGSDRDPVIQLIGDILGQRDNAPLIATVYEATQEIRASIDQRAADQSTRRSHDV